VRLDFSSILITKRAQEPYMFVLNTLCVTNFVTTSVSVFEAAMRVKAM